jgi:hypothetical protein
MTSVNRSQLPPARCIFCGRLGSPGNKLSEQHILPQWLRKVVPGAADPEQIIGRIRNNSKVDFDRGRGFTVRAKICCEECNTGWMSDLENQAKPILRPLVLGDDWEVDAENSETIARWTFMTACCAAAATGRDVSVIPRSQLLAFRDSDGMHLPMQFKVFLGHADRTEEVREGFSRTSDLLIERLPMLVKLRGLPAKGSIYRLVVKINELVIVAFGHNIKGFKYRPLLARDSQPFSNYLRRAWPASDDSFLIGDLPSLSEVGGVTALIGGPHRRIENQP